VDRMPYDDEGGGNTPIDGLIQSTTYFVRVLGNGFVQLYDTQAHATDLAHTAGLITLGPGTGSGADQRFTVATQTLFNPTGTSIHRDPIVSTANSTIFLGKATGLQNGD